jgi:hypothetical protein
MKRIAKFFPVALLMGLLFATGPRAEQNNDRTSCSLIEQALKDYQQVRTAGTRRDVAKYFVPNGGLQFPARTRYVYPKCNYIHIDIEFELVKPADIASLPDDKVIRVSRLYLEYPATD